MMVKHENSLDERGRDELSSRLADDEFWGALAGQPRRRVLTYLLDVGEAPVAELAEVLGGWEASEGTAVPPERYERFRIALVHSHLPRLDEADLVDYDRENRLVAPTDLEEPVRKLILDSVAAESG